MLIVGRFLRRRSDPFNVDFCFLEDNSMRASIHSLMRALSMLAVATAILQAADPDRAGIALRALNTIQYNNREQLATYNSATHTVTAVAAGTPLAAGMQLYGGLASTTVSPDPGPPNET